ncbi:MAG: DUF4435 domain-containing protein [Bacteroidaceae bacterium]|nr:DUF4435 domain-containing protein [Bacteroidaceae bacterium]
MKDSRLTGYINSSYLEAANRLRPKKARRKVVAYVESFDDVFFWRSVLQEFESDTVYFEVMLPSRHSLGKGKKMAMMNKLGPLLGDYMIACVDADYDWLLQGKTLAGEQFLHNPYVFHTYVYAIENYQCYAPTLHTACVMSTLNDREIFDFQTFLTEYSRIIWPLLVWSVWSHAYGAFKEYTLSSFCETVGFHEIRLNNPTQALETLRRRVNKQMGWLQRRFPQAKKTYPQVREQMIALGVQPDECYLYMQGHTLFENVVMMMLTPACAILRKEREREINQLAGHEVQRQNELSSYQHSQSPVDVMLRKSTNFKQCAQYQLLKADIMRFMTEAGLQK